MLTISEVVCNEHPLLGNLFIQAPHIDVPRLSGRAPAFGGFCQTLFRIYNHHLPPMSDQKDNHQLAGLFEVWPNEWGGVFQLQQDLQSWSMGG